MNAAMDDFMARFSGEGLTFDDVSLITQYADFLPNEAEIKTRLTRNIELNIPFVSAAMDTVTEADMAIAMAMLGGIGVVHKNLPPRRQARAVSIVKHHLNGLIRNPIVFHDTDTLGDILDVKKRKGFTFSGFPILDADEHLVGIVTAADIKFACDGNAPVTSYMTHEVITAPDGTSLEEAYEIMRTRKLGKLPLVKDGRLSGLYSYSDVRALVENQTPLYSRDEGYRLRAAAAVGPGDEERVAELASESVDVVVVDTAHGHSKGVIDMTTWIKKHYPHIDVIAGNIGTGDAAKDLLKAGADAVKVGIGPGSICTTRVVCGVGIPQVTAIHEVSRALQGEIPVIADGGIRHSGDVPKALAAGADVVMMGSVLAGTQESPGEMIIQQGRQYVVYRGMGSLAAMKEGRGSRERYGQDEVGSDDLVPQGIEGLVPYAGTVQQVLTQYCGGVRGSLGYSGCRSVRALQERGRFVRVSLAGLNEAHPHDVKITREAPNYHRS